MSPKNLWCLLSFDQWPKHAHAKHTVSCDLTQVHASYRLYFFIFFLLFLKTIRLVHIISLRKVQVIVNTNPMMALKLQQDMCMSPRDESGEGCETGWVGPHHPPTDSANKNHHDTHWLPLIYTTKCTPIYNAQNLIIWNTIVLSYGKKVLQTLFISSFCLAWCKGFLLFFHIH